jgi:hypothetical protein
MAARSIDVLGRGVRFPLGVDDAGRVAAVAEQDAVTQAVRLILETTPGERVMRPASGAGLKRFLFAPNTPATRALIAQTVRDALDREERRIAVGRVDVGAHPDDPAAVLIRIDFVIRRTGGAGSFVFPFYLTESG